MLYAKTLNRLGETYPRSGGRRRSSGGWSASWSRPRLAWTRARSPPCSTRWARSRSTRGRCGCAVQSHTSGPGSIADSSLACKHQQLTGVRQQFTGVRQQFTGVRQQFTGVRQQFTGVRQQFTEVRQQFTGVRQQFTGVRQFTEVRQQFTGMEWDNNSQEWSETTIHRNGVRQQFNKMESIFGFFI